ncbi:WAP four-disulfide core domain protein 1-like [Ornithodoros turicata]|uniref:WAP four-disulfide core domain protein 1-like n=1 Tax=Ornithodoros turicata TaxID=34597 RepID=UPI003138BCD6
MLFRIVWHSAFLVIIFCETSLCAFTTHDKDLRPLTQRELTRMMADLLAVNPSTAACPAPKVPVPQSKCRARQCARHSDCQRVSHLCCFNGCVFTCLARVTPPAVIDWEQEVSWQNTSRHITEHYRGPFYNIPSVPDGIGIICSTAPVRSPGLPLQCPEGMVCLTRTVGDPLKGVPSLGECVKDLRRSALTTADDVTDTSKLESRGSEAVFLPGGCVLSKDQYNSIKEFKQKSYVTECMCKQGSMECSINPHKHRSRHKQGQT